MEHVPIGGGNEREKIPPLTPLGIILEQKKRLRTNKRRLETGHPARQDLISVTKDSFSYVVVYM